jgi:hypothetical protein
MESPYLSPNAKPIMSTSPPSRQSKQLSISNNWENPNLSQLLNINKYHTKETLYYSIASAGLFAALIFANNFQSFRY